MNKTTKPPSASVQGTHLFDHWRKKHKGETLNWNWLLNEHEVVNNCYTHLLELKQQWTMNWIWQLEVQAKVKSHGLPNNRINNQNQQSCCYLWSSFITLSTQRLPTALVIMTISIANIVFEGKPSFCTRSVAFAVSCMTTTRIRLATSGWSSCNMHIQEDTSTTTDFACESELFE